MFQFPNLSQKWPFTVGLFKLGFKKDPTLYVVDMSLRSLFNIKVSLSPPFSLVIYLLWKLGHLSYTHFPPNPHGVI